MLKLFVIALGGAAGAVLRYLVSGFALTFMGSGFPWGTLCVNLIGSFAIGLLAGIFESVVVSANLKIFLFVGLLGAFTTFSTFSLENAKLLQDGQWLYMFINVTASCILGLLLVFAGLTISKFLIS